MEQDDMKKCPYCAELIKKDAIKCRYCGSMLTERKFSLDFLSTPGYWHRVREGKKIAGVCTGIARQLDAPVLILPLRLFFVLTTIFYGFGIILYIILWALMAPPVDKTGDTGTGSGKTEAAEDDFEYVEGSVPPSGNDELKGDEPEDQGDTKAEFRAGPSLGPGILILVCIACAIAVNTYVTGIREMIWPMLNNTTGALPVLAAAGLLVCACMWLKDRAPSPAAGRP